MAKNTRTGSRLAESSAVIQGVIFMKPLKAVGNIAVIFATTICFTTGLTSSSYAQQQNQDPGVKLVELLKYNGSASEISKLLDQVDPTKEVTYRTQYTIETVIPVFEAEKEGRADILQMMFDHGVDPKFKTPAGGGHVYGPGLDLLSMWGSLNSDDSDLKILKMLLSKGFKVNDPVISGYHGSGGEEKPLYDYLINLAVMLGRTDYSSNSSRANMNHGDLDVVKFLVEHGAKLNNFSDEETALDSALQTGEMDCQSDKPAEHNRQIVDYLVSKEAIPSLRQLDRLAETYLNNDKYSSCPNPADKAHIAKLLSYAFTSIDRSQLRCISDDEMVAAANAAKDSFNHSMSMTGTSSAEISESLKYMRQGQAFQKKVSDAGCTSLLINHSGKPVQGNDPYKALNETYSALMGASVGGSQSDVSSSSVSAHSAL